MLASVGSCLNRHTSPGPFCLRCSSTLLASQNATKSQPPSSSHSSLSNTMDGTRTRTNETVVTFTLRHPRNCRCELTNTSAPHPQSPKATQTQTLWHVHTAPECPRKSGFGLTNENQKREREEKKMKIKEKKTQTPTARARESVCDTRRTEIFSFCNKRQQTHPPDPPFCDLRSVGPPSWERDHFPVPSAPPIQRRTGANGAGVLGEAKMACA